MNTEFIKGVVVPIITVIDQDEKIDEAGMRKQVDYVIDGGLQGILAFGSNGEFYQLEEDEMERGLKIMVDQAAVPSIRRSASASPRWPSQTAHPAFPSFSRCS